MKQSFVCLTFILLAVSFAASGCNAEKAKMEAEVAKAAAEAEVAKAAAEAEVAKAAAEAEKAKAAAEAEKAKAEAAKAEAEIAKAKLEAQNVQDTAPSPTAVPSAIEAPTVPALIPEPEAAVAPEERLTFKKSIKTKKGSPEYLIFHDSQLNTPCYIAVHNYNIQAQDENRYCTPFSGNEKELTHPMAVTKTAAQYENYAYCAAAVKPEKRNIPGLAGFFKAFNPTYYASDLSRFIDEPFQIHKPKRKEGTKKEHTDYSYYIPDPHASDFEACESQENLIPNPFITEQEYKKYNLKPGDIFLTASAAKGEKVLHQYWQVITGQAEPICECEWEVYDHCNGEYEEDCAGGSGGCNLWEDIVQVKDLDNKTTYELLMPQILAGMPARNQYCEAVNNALINEARSGNWARVDNNSPLMKKK